MLVCNSIDTICFSTHLDPVIQGRLMEYQFQHSRMPKWLYATKTGIVRYGYGVESDGISIYYTDSKELNPNCYIRFSSEVIQRQGYDKVYMRCCNMLRFFGVTRPGKTLKLSQIDLAFDFQADFSKYLDDRSNYSVQTKLKGSTGRRNRDLLGYRLYGVGSSVGYKVRCYDKLQESKDKKGKLYWHEIWLQQGFSLEKPIWRIEYELRRDFLKSWKINSLRSFVRQQQAIQKRLFGLWNIKVLDDSNKSRCSYVPEFDYLFEHFAEDFKKHYVDKRPEEYERACAMKMAHAVAAFIAAATNGAAYFKLSNANGDLAASRNDIFSQFLSALHDSAIYDDDQFRAVVDDALSRRGYYFKPCGGQYSIPAYA